MSVLADAIVEGLNSEQAEAVRASEGPLLVLAGAGSGKTRVLTHRIAWLIGACGIAPESILAVTFTNKAAGEMRERVAKLLGPDAADVWVATFHATCVRILRRDIHHLGRERSFVIYDETDSLGLVREALRRHGAEARAQEARRARWRIDQWKNAGLGPDGAFEQARDIDDERLAQVYATYRDLLLTANALDFGDLMLETEHLFREHPEVLARWRGRWQYVLVDEYQDTNRVQYHLVNALAGDHRNLCVVGDPDQSVYGWRGADIRNILEFERDYPEARIVKLERNYRSTRPILEGAGAVVSHNLERKDKRMQAVRGEGDPIRLYRAHDERDEAQFVVQTILEAVRSGDRRHGDCAVFYRTNAQSRPIEEELLKYDVPYVVVGGVRFYDRAEVKDVLAWLRLVVNRSDAMALRRAVQSPPRGIGRGTLERGAALASDAGTSLFEGLLELAALGGRSGSAIDAFMTLFEEISQEVASLPPADAIARVLERSGYLAQLEREATPEAEARVENLRELVAGAEDFDPGTGEAGGSARSALELYLDQIALVSDLDALEDRRDRVSLMTAHSSKGLEFPLVFLVGMEEGVFPHAAAARDDRGIEEERRLCYVGMTRAMERLTLSWALERRRWGSRSFGTVSRFLREIPAQLVVGASPEADEPTAVAGGDAVYDYSYAQAEPGEATAARGGRVRHPIFGVGTILAVEGSGPRQKLRIRFDRAGVKTLVLRFANLEFV